LGGFEEGLIVTGEKKEGRNSEERVRKVWENMGTVLYWAESFF